jgi:phytanoyl-CoA hydroxylase
MKRYDQFQKDGYLILKDFYTKEQCDELMLRGEELSNKFSFDGHPSIFQTSEQTRTSDDYFLNSGENISYFLEGCI